MSSSTIKYTARAGRRVGLSHFGRHGVNALIQSLLRLSRIRDMLPAQARGMLHHGRTRAAYVIH